MSSSLETSIASESYAVPAEGTLSTADRAMVEASDNAEPSPSAGGATNVADIAGLDEATKVRINADWTALRQRAGAEAMNGMLRGDAQTQRSIAMLALQVVMFPGNDWAQEASDIGVETHSIRSKHPLAMAVAATFGLKPYSEDAKVAKQDGQYLDRWALAAEGLKNQILAMTPQELEKVTLDESGIKAVEKLLSDAGGINALAATQRKARRQTPDQRDYQIDLALAQVDEILVTAGRRALLAGVEGVANAASTISLALADVDGNPILLPTKFDVDSPLLSPVLRSLAPVDPVLDTVGELLKAGMIVEERETKIPQNNLEDPENPNTEMRLASRHFVLQPDGTMLISPILNLDSPVVVVKTTQPILPTWPKTLHHFQTFGRRKAEVNIVDPDRRKLFDLRVEDPGNTLGHARVVLTTTAAAKPEDADRDVGFLVEPLRSAPGNFPLGVQVAAFRPTLECSFDGNAQKLLLGIAGSLKSAGDKPVSISFDGDNAKFRTTRELLGLDAKSSKTGTVTVLAAHLRAVLSTIADLPLAEDLVFATDFDGAVRISFATKRADYAVFIPARADDGARSNRCFKPLTLD